MPLQINYTENMLIVLTARNVNFFTFNIAVKLLQPFIDKLCTKYRMKCYNLSFNDNLSTLMMISHFFFFIHVCHKRIAKYSAVLIVSTKVAKTHPHFYPFPCPICSPLCRRQHIAFKVFVEKVMKIIKMTTCEK